MCRIVLVFAGAIFDENSEEAQIAFKYAVIRENMYDGKFELVPVIKTIQSTESSAAEQAGKLIARIQLTELQPFDVKCAQKNENSRVTSSESLENFTI